MHRDVMKRAGTFYLLAVALSWIPFFVLIPLVPPQAGIAVLALFMFGPLAAALITQRLNDRGQTVVMLALRAGWSWWWLLAWLIPPVLVAAALGVTLLLPGVEPQSFTAAARQMAAQQGLEMQPSDIQSIPPLWLVIALATLLGGPFNMLFALGEEAGWRGYFWTVLRPLGFWRATLIAGLAWGLWHAPVIIWGHNYGTSYWGYPWLGILMMMLFCIGLSPLLGLLRDATRSVWPAALFHGTLNAVAGLFLVLQTGAHPLMNGIVGGAGVIVLIATSACVAVALPRLSAGAAGGGQVSR